MNRRMFAVIALSTVIGLTFAACTPPASPGGGTTGAVYKIGFNSSATAASASLGLPEAKTAQMLEKQINDGGGIAGPDGVKHKVQIVIYDDKSNADAAVQNVTRLINEDEVIAVVSASTSGNSVAHIPVCQESQVPCVSMASAKGITTDPKANSEYKWMFKTPQTNAMAGEWQAAYLKAKAVDSICILHTSDSYGTDTFNTFKAAAEKAGIKVSYDATYAATDTEFSAQIAGVQGAGCKAVEIGSTSAVASLVTVALRTALPEMPILSGHGICDATFIKSAGQAANGVAFPCGKVTVVDQVPDSDPQKAVLQKYIKDYQAFTGGEAISTFGGHAYDGVMMVVAALGSLKDGMALKDQRAAVRDYLETKIVNWPGISGTFTFSPTDHNGLSKESLLFVKVVDGKWVAYPQKDW